MQARSSGQMSQLPAQAAFTLHRPCITSSNERSGVLAACATARAGVSWSGLITSENRSTGRLS